MPVTFDTAAFSFDAFGFCQTESKSIRISNTDAVDAAVSLSGAGMTLSPAVASVPAGGSVTVKVSFRPTGVADVVGTLTAGSASIAVTGKPKNPLEVDRSQLAFGSVVVGQQSWSSVLVRNRGDQAAAPSGSGTDAAMFDTAVLSAVPGGALLSYPVKYAPTAVGGHAATLTLTVGPWSVTCSLSGTGVTTLPPPVTTFDNIQAGMAETGTGRNQSYFVSVPTPRTIMNLGYQRSERIKAPGFGFDTDKNGYLNAAEEIGIQATKNVYVQSTAGNINILAGRDGSDKNGDAVVAAQNAAYLLGNNGVFIGTVGDRPVSNDGSTLMPNEDKVTAAKTAANAAALVFAIADVAVGTATTVYGAKQVIMGIKSGAKHFFSTPGSYTKMLGVIGGMTGTVASLTSAIGAVASLAGGSTLSPPGVTIYGHAGVLMGTPGFSSIYAGAGLVLSSAFPSLLGYDTTVMAVHDVGITALSGEANLSGKETVVHGSKKLQLDSPVTVDIFSKTATTTAQIEVKSTPANPITTITVKNATNESTIDITPGSVVITAKTAAGTSTVTVNGTGASIKGGAITLDGDVTITGNVVMKKGLEVKKLVSAKDGLSVTGTIAASGDVSAPNLTTSATAAAEMQTKVAALQTELAKVQAAATTLETALKAAEAEIEALHWASLTPLFADL